MSEMLPPSWSEMSQQIERGERSQAWKKAGAWAVERLAQHLGERWPQDVWGKYSDLPGGMRFASSHTVAFVELLELALRLELVRDLPRFVSLRRALRTDARGELVRHVRIQLEVAALGLRHGHHVDFEPPIPSSSKRGDLAMDVGSEEPILIETRALLIDNRTREINAFTDELFWRIRLAVSPYGAECSGTVSKVLDDVASAELLGEIETRARLVAVGMHASPVRAHGAELIVSRAGERDGKGLTGPRIEGNGWPRVADRLKQKAEQTRGARNVWLRFDVLDGLWQFTPWSQGDLATKAIQLETVVFETLEPYRHVDGVALSSGALLAQGEFVDEDQTSAQGTAATRRVIPPLRVRETFVVPVVDSPAPGHIAAWRAFYELEPSWLDWALARFDLPRASELFPTTE
ncbi:MAG TPA: hypothetical protein VFI17_11530 [Solirubrobacterales bacterium]|nr:hypothetical protein [Solirubrobacterales bacterium]